MALAVLLGIAESVPGWEVCSTYGLKALLRDSRVYTFGFFASASVETSVVPENRQCHLSNNAFVTILHEFQIGQLKQNV